MDYNIFSDSNTIELSQLNLEEFISFLKDYNEEEFLFKNLHQVEKLIDQQFFFSIDTRNESFNKLQNKLKLLEDLVRIIEWKLENNRTIKAKDTIWYKERIETLKIKIDSYKLFYEQRTSRNLTTNIFEISDFNTKKWMHFLWKDKEKKTLDFKTFFEKLKKLEINQNLLYGGIAYSSFIIILIISYFKINQYTKIELWYFLICFLIVIWIHTLTYRKGLKYKKFKEILVNTYRFSSISQRLFYINENEDPNTNKIDKQKELVEYYDKHLEKEQNRQVKYWYAKKLFILLIIESFLLFAVFWLLIYKLNIDDITKIANILKRVFWLTLGQIIWMIIIIVKYLFKDNEKINNK